MSEAARAVDAAPEAVAGSVADASAGTLLRQAREATGLHIAALAVAMKVPVRKLEALEADRLGDLHDAVFVRAFAASMCRALKIDPAPVLNRLPQTVAPKLEREDRGIHMPHGAPGLVSGAALTTWLSKPSVLLVAALLLAALAVMVFPESAVKDRVAQTVGQPEAALPASPASEPAAVAQGSPAGPSAAAQPASSTPVAAALPPAAPASPVAAAPASVAAPPAPAAQIAPLDWVVFKARDSSWVRVSDSAGAVQLEKTLAAGESVGASGTPPLAIVVGNVAGTELLVRGKAFNLDEVARNNVARFEVK